MQRSSLSSPLMGPLSRFVVDRQARLRVEEVQPAGVDDHLDGACPRCTFERGSKRPTITASSSRCRARGAVRRRRASRASSRDVLGDRPGARRSRRAPSISEPSASRSSTCALEAPVRRRVRGDRRVLQRPRAGCPRITSRARVRRAAPGAVREQLRVERDPLVAEHGARARRRARSSARLEQVHRRAADEAGDEQVDRAVVELLRARRPAAARPCASPRRGRPSSSPRPGRA